MDQAKRWLEECDLQHAECSTSAEKPLPTRILDLGEENAASNVVLRDGQGMFGKYACLSYCWGKSKPFVTTASNQAQRLDGFAAEELPTTLRDAVYFTKELGLRYLWVDALCILQDDRGDWERESAKMSHVYGQSYITLCASHTGDINDGLFRPFDHVQDGPFLLQETRNGHRAPIYARRELSHHQFGCLDDAVPGIWAEDRYPLMERAWALQEHLLSPRVLQFAAHELVWECWGHSSCGCGRLNRSRAARSYLLRPTSGEEASDLLSQIWKSVVRAYSSRIASDPRDKLPALSGLAHSLEDRMSSRYLAGIWERDFVNGLLWYKPPSALQRYPQRPVRYRAPSWSWASVDGHVSHINKLLSLETQIVEIYEAQTVLSGSDPMGAVSRGYIKMRALLTEVRYEYTEPQLDHYHPIYACKKYHLCTAFNPNWAFELPGLHYVPSGTSFPCIILGYSDHALAIVLRQLDFADHTFERIGSFFVDESEESTSWFEDARMTQLTIV